MKTIPLSLLTALVSVVLCTGCSVKEDRDKCPSRLVLDFSQVDTSAISSADLIIRADDGFVFTDELDSEDFRAGVTVDIPRGNVTVGVWTGTEGMLSPDGLEIPQGKDCPPLYFHTSVFDNTENEHRETVRLRKNHCRMTVILNNIETEPKGVSLTGNIAGYALDGTPEEGRFSCRLSPDGKGGHLVVLPRQTDDSLTMEIDDGSDVVKRLSLGGYIAETGYDWNAPDLEDLVVEVDMALTSVRLSIPGWDKVHEFDIVY